MKTFRMSAFCSFALLSLALTASAQQDVITTVAGGGPNGIPGINANLDAPYAVAVDGQGNVYVADNGQHRIFEISTTGILTVVAGTGFAGYSGDGGSALNAELNFPSGVAVDGGDPANIYIGDRGNCLVRKVDQSTGIITSVAGKLPTGSQQANCGYSGDGGPAEAAELFFVEGLAVNPVNNDVYVADSNNGRVRKIAGGLPTGTIATVAGGGGSTTEANDCEGDIPWGDGSAATSAILCDPRAVSLDTTANPVNLFISDGMSDGRPGNCVVREVVGSSGDIYRVAGSYTLGCGFMDSAVATSGELNLPWQSHVSVNGATTTVTFADLLNARIRQFTLTYASGVPQPGALTTIAGNGVSVYCGDNGPALSACMTPAGVDFDASGNIYIGDADNARVRQIARSDGHITPIDGWGTSAGPVTTYSNPVGITNVPGTGLALYRPYGILADPASTAVYIAGFGEAATYVLNSTTGKASQFAGNGLAGFAGDGTAANGATTQLDGPAAFARDSSGNIYIADTHNCVIREVLASTGNITTIAGGHEGHGHGCGFSGNGGPAVNAQINYVFGLAIDAADNIYIAEYEYVYPAYTHCDVRKIAADTGIITAFAGNGTCGHSGDGGPAIDAELLTPYDLSFDGSGNLYIADTLNQRIRKVDATTHIITTVAGNGAAGYIGDGQATAVRLNNPQGVYADPNGNLFIADYTNGIVRWVSPAGQLITFGGKPKGYGFNGDGGVATSALFALPARITQDSSGNSYIADYNNGLIRKISAFAGIGLSTSSLNFNTQKVGTTSAYQAIKVSAVGPITISKVAVTAGFSEKDNCAGVTLAARQTCTINVSFSPAGTGSAQGVLTLTDNAFFPTSGNTVTLTGMGTP